MSSVRMCDNCGKIFSENEEGWSTYTGTLQKRRDDGSRYTERAEQDRCAECTPGTKPPAPRLALAEPPQDKTAALENDNRDLRIQQLEREVEELRHPILPAHIEPPLATAMGHQSVTNGF